MIWSVRPNHLFDARSHDDERVEVELPPHEAAGYVRVLASADHGVETIARGLRDRDQDDVGPRPGEHALDVAQAAEHRHALHAAPAQARVVVDEADHLRAGSLAELAKQAADAASGADEQGPVAVGTGAEATEPRRR